MTSSTLIRCVIIRRAAPADAAGLAAFAAQAFADTFGADNTADDMAAYLAHAFGDATQRAELEDPAVTVLLAEADGELAGYVMLRDGTAPSCVPDAPTLEIARLYAGRRWIGAGLGARLMQRSLDEATALGKRSLWLGVWERNARAIAFYERWGFTDVGAQSFRLGNDVQTDRIMTRRVGGD